MAVHATSLVEDAALVHGEAFRDASKHYPFFPMLLASKDGRDTRQKLARIDAFPVGQNRPFKRLRGQARNDDLRAWIERCYDDIQRVRNGKKSGGLAGNFAGEMCKLPTLNTGSARRWASLMARNSFASPGGAELPGILGVDVSKETAKKRRRKESRLRAKYGGTRLIENHERARPGDALGENDGSTRFFVAAGNAGAARELDAVEATKFNDRSEKMRNTAQTGSDEVNAFADAIEKRLLSILK